MREFDTVEINNSFYQLPSEDTVSTWAEAAPEAFRFAMKFSRYGSHMKKLKEPEDSINKFMHCARRLGTHRGPFLVQLPPHWNANPGRLRSFLQQAPAKERWAFEFRDRSWLTDEVFDILREHSAALCFHDLLTDHPRVVTAPFVYERFHGGDYTQSYSHQALTAIARRVSEHAAEGLDVYAYFNNDAQGNAVKNARDVIRYLGRSD
jgi:uncharacterized protein YecE (DUF72 family)